MVIMPFIESRTKESFTIKLSVDIKFSFDSCPQRSLQSLIYRLPGKGIVINTELFNTSKRVKYYFFYIDQEEKGEKKRSLL